MIKVRETSHIDCTKTNRLLHAATTGRYNFNRLALIKKSAQIKDSIANEVSMIDRNRKICLAAYINNVLVHNLNKNNNLHVRWEVSDESFVRTLPISLRSFRSMGFDIVDYINATDDKTVAISYKDMWDAMTFAIAFEDMGFERMEIEKAFEDCRISAVNDNSKLMQFVDDDMFNSVSKLRIENCWCIRSTRDNAVNYATDYFGVKVESPEYEVIVGRSVKRMMGYILGELLENISSVGKGKYAGYNAEFLGMYDDRIYFCTNMDSEKVNNILAQEASLRIFGREFAFKPRVYEINKNRVPNTSGLCS